jgi:hypothetical protein
MTLWYRSVVGALGALGVAVVVAVVAVLAATSVAVVVAVVAVCDVLDTLGYDSAMLLHNGIATKSMDKTALLIRIPVFV